MPGSGRAVGPPGATPSGPAERNDPCRMSHMREPDPRNRSERRGTRADVHERRAEGEARRDGRRDTGSRNLRIRRLGVRVAPGAPVLLLVASILDNRMLRLRIGCGHAGPARGSRRTELLPQRFREPRLVLPDALVDLDHHPELVTGGTLVPSRLVLDESSDGFVAQAQWSW